MTILDTIKCESSEDIRLYDYCNGKFKQLPSRKSLKKAIDHKLVLVNGIAQKTGFWLRGGERIDLIASENKPPKPYKLDLEILFEDDHLIIVNKPAGLRVSGNQFKTLFNVLAYNFTVSKAEGALDWPLPVHRRRSDPAQIPQGTWHRADWSESRPWWGQSARQIGPVSSGRAQRSRSAGVQ